MNRSTVIVSAVSSSTKLRSKMMQSFDFFTSVSTYKNMCLLNVTDGACTNTRDHFPDFRGEINVQTQQISGPKQREAQTASQLGGNTPGQFLLSNSPHRRRGVGYYRKLT